MVCKRGKMDLHEESDVGPLLGNVLNKTKTLAFVCRVGLAKQTKFLGIEGGWDVLWQRGGHALERGLLSG